VSEDNAAHDGSSAGANLLAEVMYAVEQLQQEPSAYPAIYDLAVTCEQSGFVESSLVLYDRCLRLPISDDDLQTTYANLTAAYHAAAAAEPDPAKRNRHIHDGLYAATAALDPEGSRQPRPTCIALAHRAVLFAEIGHYESALADARRARAMAVELDMRRERVVAAVGEVLARWNSSLDTTVLLLIEEVKALADDLDVDDLLRPLTDVEVDVLWSMGQYAQARAVMQRDAARLNARLHRQTADRWENVRAGVSRLRHSSVGESDALTGLPNRTFLGRWLPEALSDDAPVCIAALNLDRFGFVNERHGYEAGDSVLQEVASVLERICRRNDSVMRVGDDEFVIVLRDVSAGDARIVFERVRQLIAARSWSALPADAHLTASVGVTVGSGAINSTTLLASANEALRRAKAAGGDRISFR
jgi:diguanylate cyclase (GGDEF)-like protein